jgi:RNA polymerase sigma-70 factor (ECF subfamily)
MDASIKNRLSTLVVSGGQGRTTAVATGSPITETDPSDEVLLAQICKGSRESLGILFGRYARLVRGVAFRILRDRCEADDLLQEVFLFINRTSDVFDNTKSSARSWIVQMTYHRAIDRRRHLQSRHFYTQVDLDGATEIPDPRSEGLGAKTFAGGLAGNPTIQGLLDTLTQDQRNTLSLHFYEGYTFAEIAVKLDQSLGNIRNHYYRGLEKLRKQMFPGKSPGRDGHGRK